MNGALTHRFAIVLRPLRQKDGARQTEYLQARTAAQAARAATARWPELKVVEVMRAEGFVRAHPEVARQLESDELDALEAAHVQRTLAVMRRAGA